MADLGHNSGARAQVIREVCQQLADLEAERAAASEAMSELKKTRIKRDLGMKVADFNAAYRLFKLERNDRDGLLDTIRETFEAMNVGDQLDWISAGRGGAD